MTNHRKDDKMKNHGNTTKMAAWRKENKMILYRTDRVETVHGEDMKEAVHGKNSEAAVHISDIIKSILMLALSTLIGMFLWWLGLSEANIIMVYILGVLFTAMITNHQMYSLISSLVTVLVFNFLFTEPRFSLRAYDKDYPVTFVTMFVAAFLTSSLAIRLKKQAKEKEQAALMAQREQLRANLLRSISHDLRTPLTSISGNASNLLSNGEKIEEEAKRQLYSDIYEDSMWLINLVENLLSITKLEEGNITIHTSTELLDEVIAEALQHIHRKKVEHHVVVEAKDELILVKVDARLIMQVIVNLLDNAIKYTHENSEIVISFWKEEKKAVVQIADNGPGISEDKKPYVFDMFYSGAKSIADSRRSLGLGLALCKSILLAHGGEITLTDNVPTGAVFTFTLPLEEVDLHEQDPDISGRGR